VTVATGPAMAEGLAGASASDRQKKKASFDASLSRNRTLPFSLDEACPKEWASAVEIVEVCAVVIDIDSDFDFADVSEIRA